MYPYVGAKHHVLLIHREHIEDMSELSPEAWAELQQVVLELCKERGITGGGFIMRFGETKYTGASVTHLHAHLVQSDPTAPGYSDIKQIPGLAIKMG
jgi:diadenosine tetraphosphate (Ap4A) HIT family hydrolase